MPRRPAANVPIIIALNKMDLPNKNPDRVKQQLAEIGVVVEEYGGDVVLVPVSARTKAGLDELLEMVLLLAELQELKADPAAPARGVVIESRLDKSRGPVATLIVQQGTLKVGDTIICGTSFGRIRALLDEYGRRLPQAGPSTPAEVLGLNHVPTPGDVVIQVADEKSAREYLAKLAVQERQQRQRVTLETMGGTAGDEVKELDIVLKADTHGSMEAIRQALDKLAADEMRVRIIHSGVGPVSESDVQLALAGQAVIIGFNVRPDAAARALADQEGIQIRYYDIIYNLIEDVEKALRGLLAPEIVEVVDGQAEVRAVFRVAKGETILGALVQDGTFRRGAEVRVLRGGKSLLTSKISSLRRFKDDVREVAAGYECGIGIATVYEAQAGDILECFHREEKARG